MTTIFELLEQWTVTQPGKILFEFRNRQGEATERYTYQSFQERTLSLAAHLMEVSALRAGDRVLIAYPPGLKSITALLACARAGLIGVPVAFPKSHDDAAVRRLLAIAADCEPAAFLSDNLHAGKLPRLIRDSAQSRLRILNTDEFVDTAARPARRCHDEVLFLQYTSGSTGHPRGVVVSHGSVIANAQATLDHTPIGVSWLPQHHDMGLIGYYLFPIVSGGTSYGFAPADFLRRPAAWLRMISDVQATYTSSPNFGYEYCLRDGMIREDEVDGVDLSSLRVLMNAAEPARRQTILRFYQRFRRYGLRRAACTVAYGLAENTLNVAHGGLNTLRLDRQALNAGRIVIVEGSHGREIAEYASCGKPAPGVVVRIRDPDSCRPSAPLGIGEICIGGASVTRGYWNNQEATRRLFCSDDDAGNRNKPLLRTGDLGFLHADELYVCGRIKDLIKVRGANFFPDDLEAAIDTSGAAVRPRGCCAFQTLDGRVVILVEPMRVDNMPDPARLARWVRKSCGLLPDFLAIVPPRTIVITTSGKIGRADTRALFLAGNVQVLAACRSDATPDGAVMNPSTDWRAAVRCAYSRLGIADDNEALADLGVDSLGLTELQLELEEALRRFGFVALAESLDAPLLQRLSLRDLLSLLEPLDRGPGEGARAAFDALTSLRASTDDAMRAQMLLDKYRPFQNPSLRAATHSKGGPDILLTGATGFFGPFLLDELLRQTGATIHVLVRASGSEHAMERIEAALQRARLPTSTRCQTLRNRVRPVCGDLSLPKWGLTDAQWDALARRVGEVYHNGACVNYVMTYEAMRGANIDGTHTALQLAFDSGARTLHLVSSTFIFGWTAKGVLLETDCNIEMQALDFGYAQSKWVAEQQAIRARAHGLNVRIYRPSLISVSTRGAGDADDVAIRVLAFMIRHGIAVDTPNQLSIVAADVLAHNLIGISLLKEGASPALHLTADRYYSMTDLTRVITRDFGYPFTYYDIPNFIDRLNRLCSPGDPVYPLLDFFNRSADKIAVMRLKRYSKVAYHRSRARLHDPIANPTLSQTAGYLMRYLLEQGLIEPLGARPRYGETV
jgi:thioester reductase-like protein